MLASVLDELNRLEQQTQPDEIDLGPNGSSLDLLRAIYRDPTQPLSVRMRASIASLPFEFPKLAVTANINTADFANALEEAIARSGQSLVIDHKPVLRTRR